MNNEPSYHNQPRNNNGRPIAGLILLGVGAMLLLRQFDFFYFPGWIFSFPSLLIVIGLFQGAKDNFKKPWPFALILIGFVFLSRHILPWFDLRDFFFPLAIIGIGFWLIAKRKSPKPWDKKKDQFFDKQPVFTEADYVVRPEGETATEPGTTEQEPSQQGQSAYSYIKGDDVLDIVSVFGGVKRTVLSKAFKGGEIVNIFGGAEVDFTRADIQGPVVVEITQLFGGTKLLVPPHWQVVSDVSSVFAGVDDKRFGNATQSSDKILYLKGISVFAGIDIRSF
ncbi:LiaF transmembrane domain-containing protein [Mucilaginibacter aquatilis]|uniref:LiaF transmembrane domain-containing protein n=1 Tax=Mucilaginibacter aquatilis TaxID=1517760 RepID=A0A6I4IPW7_9SPHI|nr:DUF5668 domain-containing protein [Mucilaginibacter aquatilis]MVN90034.1 hypothetical protein [Mucilaginibacter aquatilis]